MKRNFQRGTISVFLTIILVPCIVVSSIFVDLSRVKLSQGVATSSADLALNSLMSYYDKDLSQIYGMMASCQNIEEFYEESAQLFLDALHSQGLDNDDIDSLIMYYSAIVGDDTIYDLLQMELQGEGGQIINEVEGTSLGESSVLIKDQIVDFMKYRGPVNIIKGIVTRINENNVASQIEEASKNEPLVEDKQAYGEAEGELLDACYTSYTYLEEYVKLKPSQDELDLIAESLKECRELYREINTAMVTNFSNTSGMNQFYRPAYSIDMYSNTYQKTYSSVYSRKETVDGAEHYYVDGNDIKNSDGTKGIIPDLQNKINAFNNAKTNIVNAANTWIDMGTGTGANQVNEIQWWVKVNGAISSHLSNYRKAADNMLKTYSKMKAMLECEDGNEVPVGWRDECTSLMSQVELLQRNYLKSGVTSSSDRYLILVNRLETISARNINNITSSKFTLSNGKTIGATVSEISSSLTANKSKLEKCVEYLNIVIDGNILKGVKSLNAIQDLVADYENAFEDWESTANNTDTSMAADDRDLIDEERNKYDEINEQSVTELKTRLVNIRSQMKEVINTIDDVVYGSKKIAEIRDFNGVYNTIKSKISTSQIGMTNGELTSYAKEVFASAFKPYSENFSDSILSLPYSGDDNYNPDLSINPPALYSYMKSKFDLNGETEESLNENKGKIKDKKDVIENGQEDTEDRSDGISKTNIYGNYSGGDFPSGLDAGSPYQLGTSILQSISGLANNIKSGSYTDLRDSLYATEYVMSMFSYATYAKEGKYHLYKENNENNPIPDNVSFDDYNDDWENIAKTFTDNKTLTNYMINAANNVAYQAEAEYVLYGNTNEKNVNSAYGDIYTIRYALNLVSGFQNFWTGTNNTTLVIDRIADSVFGATQGIIPTLLTKSVLIALLTVFETGNDLNRLQAGLPVEIYKQESDWRYVINEDWSLNPKTGEKDNSSGLFYSDYIYMFLYLGFESSSASEMYLRIGDLIQANMRVHTGSGAYTLKNARTYFSLNATIRVKPLMLALPYADSYSNNPKDLTDWCTFQVSEIRGYS